MRTEWYPQKPERGKRDERAIYPPEKLSANGGEKAVGNSNTFISHSSLCKQISNQKNVNDL
jgi:hypothetical protein